MVILPQEMTAATPETIVVGAGIVGLTVAERLARTGQKVSVIDARPDPFTKTSWYQLGTTYASMDARHVSTTEHVSKARPLSAENFLRLTKEGGFLTKPLEDSTPREQWWIRTLVEITQELEFVDFVDFHIWQANFLGLKGWRSWMSEDPDLFKDVGLQNGVPIFYTDERELETALASESKWDEVRRLDSPEIKMRFPKIAPHFENGLLIGGFETDSFAFGIHRFARNLRNHAQEAGVSFEYEQPVIRIERNDDGEVTGIRMQDGRLKNPPNIVFCTGVFGREVLAGARTPAIPDLLMGVAGFWVDLPGVDGLGGAFKLSTAHLNVTPYEGGTYASGGFVFTGEETKVDFSNPGVNAGLRNLQEVVGQIFPGSPQTSIQACIRPMSLSGWELSEDIPTAQGGHLIISTGQGAGGTTQAPYVAERVCEIITGNPSDLLIYPAPDSSEIAPAFERLSDRINLEALYSPQVLAEFYRIYSSVYPEGSPN